MIKRRYLAFVIFATLLTTTVAFSAERGSFSARLSGGEAVPRVKTVAKGDAKFKLSKDGKELTYKVTVADIENVTAAHIHQGAKGKNGPPVVGLFAGPKKGGKFSGVLAEGVITRKDLLGDLAGKPLTALVHLIRTGHAYVNVHTDGYPDGEIRGEIR